MNTQSVKDVICDCLFIELRAGPYLTCAKNFLLNISGVEPVPPPLKYVPAAFS